MSFDMLSFWGVFCFVLVLYWVLQKKSYQNYLLLAASLFFYSAWDYKFTLLLLASSSVDFFVAIQMDKQQNAFKRKAFLALSLVLNLGLLFFFKYYLVLVHRSDASTFLPTFDGIYKWGLPLGISFYTFQILSYTIDVYKRKIAATKSFVDFILFVSFFPQLVAGPIEKARHLLPQIQTSRKFSLENLEQGFYLCLWGLFKKIYVANGLAHPLSSYMAQPEVRQAPETILMFLIATVQIYADFSGYSDIARGLARMLGFEIMINFKPFWTSKNPSDFWQKWHISLTRWLRDYVFLPLHNKGEDFIFYAVKMIFVMALVGVWHAATFNWLLFGLLNGVVIVLYQLAVKVQRFPKLVGAVTLLCLYFGNSLLYATSTWHQLIKNLSSLQNWTSWMGTADLLLYASWFVIPLFVIESFVPMHNAEQRVFLKKLVTKFLFCLICFVGIIFLERSKQLGFIYFDF